MFFEGFELERVDVGGLELRVRHGGHGPPVLLLHGHPRTHTTWHRVAPLLAERYTVVCPDLRGYGESDKPPTDAEHAPYSKRAMAGDALALMAALGHDRFAVAGHDRGSSVAYRLAMGCRRAPPGRSPPPGGPTPDCGEERLPAGQAHGRTCAGGPPVAVHCRPR